MTAEVTTPTSATIGEIHQQPQAWRELVAAMAVLRPGLDAFLAEALADRDTRIVFTGAGTSAFAGVIAAESLRPRLRRRVDAVATTDIVAAPAAVLAEGVPVLLVSFARSGNSPESLAATELVDAIAPAAHHLVITCDATGALARGHRDHPRSFVLDMPAQTNDTGFAMTSSFSTMLLAALLAFVPEDAGSVDRIAEAAEAVLHDAVRAERVLDVAPRRLVYLGSGALAGLAQECALKVLELTAGRIAAFHDSPLGFRHGPKAVVDDETLVVVIRSSDPHTRQYDDDIVDELRATRPGHVLVVGADADTDPFAVPLTPVDGLDDGLRAVAAVVFPQLLAHAASVALGCTPDNPFPDGTVNRVVQGVTIHPFGPQDPA